MPLPKATGPRDVLLPGGSCTSLCRRHNRSIPVCRSALCWKIEIARLARAHNNANVLAMPARFISDEIALQIVDIFLKTDFDGGRHTRRIGKIAWKDENDDFNQDVDQMEDMHDEEL